MDTTEPHDLPVNTIWYHKQSSTLVRLLGGEDVAGVAMVRRMNVESNAIRWVELERFVRDYELIPDRNDA